MRIDFNFLPESARIWIYQSSRKLTPGEAEAIQQMADNFVMEWTAHGSGLNAGSTILHDFFLILAVDEKFKGASGCSIDASVRFIRQLENRFNINFMDRSKIAYFKDEVIELVDMKSIKNEIDTKTITEDTLIFDNLVQTKGELKKQWLVPARESWMKKYVKNYTI
jgi:hypothetical protein